MYQITSSLARTTTETPLPWPSQAVGNPKFRHCSTYEHNGGVALMLFCDFISHCPYLGSCSSVKWRTCFIAEPPNTIQLSNVLLISSSCLSQKRKWQGTPRSSPYLKERDFLRLKLVKQRTLWYTLPTEWNSSELKGGKMYGQNIHRPGAVHLTSYARDMLIRERIRSGFWHIHRSRISCIAFFVQISGCSRSATSLSAFRCIVSTSHVSLQSHRRVICALRFTVP
jgi:hypothetical protein